MFFTEEIKAAIKTQIQGHFKSTGKSRLEEYDLDNRYDPGKTPLRIELPNLLFEHFTSCNLYQNHIFIGGAFVDEEGTPQYKTAYDGQLYRVGMPREKFEVECKPHKPKLAKNMSSGGDESRVNNFCLEINNLPKHFGIIDNSKQ